MRIYLGAFCILLLGVLGVAIYPFVAGPPNLSRISVPLDLPENDQLLRLLKAEQFASLNKELAALQRRYERGIVDESHVVDAFSVFERVDPDLAGPLDRWRQAFPSSFAPHLAIGVYNVKLAWATRGENWAAYTNEEQFKAMSRFLNQAHPALWEAVSKSPRLPVAWAALITVAMGMGDRSQLSIILDKALKHVPNSSKVYWNYHYAISKKWSGSDSAQTLLRLKLRWLFYDDPNFRWVYFHDTRDMIRLYLGEKKSDGAALLIHQLMQGLNPVRASTEKVDEKTQSKQEKKKLEKRAEAALALIDETLPYWNTAWLRNRRGDSLARLRRLDEAHKEYEHALRLSPNNVETRKSLVWVLSRKKRYFDAHDQWKAIISNDPYNPLLLVEYAQFLNGLQMAEQAGEQLEKALHFGSHDDRLHIQVGILYWIWELPDQALAEMKRAVELVPNLASNWYFYGSALKRTQSCDAIEAYRRYLALCNGRDQCDEIKISIARTELKNIEAGCD